MTNAQKWVAAFLGLFLILFLLSRVTKNETAESHPMGNMPAMGNETSTEEADAPALLSRLGCTSCHGENLEGTKLAPQLVQISKYWSRDALLNYLRNPSSYNGDARFDAYRQQYKNIVMPSFGNIDVKELGKIADYLMTK